MLEIPKSRYYRNLKEKKDKNISLKQIIKEIYEDKPFYGYRKIKVELLKKYNQKINSKKIIKLKKEMGLETIYPKVKTRLISKKQRKYRYLLKGMKIEE